MNKKILFCGGGNMAEGIIKTLLRTNTFTSNMITVSEILPARREYLSQTYSVKTIVSIGESVRAESAACGLESAAVADAVQNADFLIVAVQPQQVTKVLAALAPKMSENALIISIAAGVTIETVSAAVCSGMDVAGDAKGEHSVRIARVMPNTLSSSGNGYSAFCMNENCSDENACDISEILSALGQVMRLQEEMFDTFTAFSCTGPLWIYKMIEAMTDAGVYSGFSRKDARDIVIRNMIGAASLLDTTGEHPAVKVDQMTSPGGTSIEVLKVLQEKGFANAIMASVDAGVKKTKSLR